MQRMTRNPDKEALITDLLASNCLGTRYWAPYKTPWMNHEIGHLSRIVMKETVRAAYETCDIVSNS